MQLNGFRAVIPAKAGIQIFSRRKPGTRLDPVFQRGDEGAPDPRLRGESRVSRDWIPVCTGMTLVNQRPHLY
jgi:hypothetical protein